MVRAGTRKGRTRKGLEPRPGQGQGRDLSLEPHEPGVKVSRQRLGRGQGNDWAGACAGGLGREGAGASAWVRTHDGD